MGELKVESGQRWRHRTRPDDQIVLLNYLGERWWECCSQSISSIAEPTLAVYWEPAAPAPRHGQVWKSAERCVTLAQLGEVTFVANADGRAVCGGHVLHVARTLLNWGARYVGELDARAPLRALADAVVEVTSPRAREAAKRCVDELVDLQSAFGVGTRAVLASVVETRPASHAELVAIAAGCRAWELRRSEVAPGRRKLTTQQEISCGLAALEAAMDGGGVWPANAGEIYERARATC